MEVGLSTLRNERAGTTIAEFTATVYLIRTVISKKEEKNIEKMIFFQSQGQWTEIHDIDF